MELLLGPAGVCFDATALITYNKAGRLDLFESLLLGCAFTPHYLKHGEVVKRLDQHPESARIRDADWLVGVKVDDPDDTRLVARLLSLWGSKPGYDQGEAEVIALCRRYGWTAVMDDRQGRKTALQYGVNCVTTVTLVLAAAALSIEGAPGRKAAWEMHQEIEAERNASSRAMPIEDEYRPAFMTSLKAIRKLWQSNGEPAWPDMLADQNLDEIVKQAVGRTRATLT